MSTKILPAIAFIGGAGEIAYWLQLKNLFAHFNIQFPMLLQRDSFVLVDAATNKKLLKLQLDPIDFFADEQALIAGYVKNNSGQELSIEAEKKEMDAIFEGLLKKAVSIDSTLDKAVLAEKQAVLNAIAKLESKLLKAEKAKMEVQIGQITAIRAKLLPEGGMQERSENFISWYLKMGPAFIDTLLSFTEQPAQTVTLLVFEE
ncbi:MAG: bacillithiol biosynthesis BshC [Bacteroidetes bacterium]|nr:bacillithiol biosynthesis BshC [Bacteroidota bacterium]